VFESGFTEGQDSINWHCECGLSERRQMPIRIIKTIEPFEILYPVLYYLYTDRIWFTTRTAITLDEFIHGVPACSAEEAFAIADRFGLDELKEKSMAFLVDTCDESNVLSRVFGEFALMYDDIGRRYDSVFYRHWNSLRNSQELTEFFEGLENDTDEVRRLSIYRRCWKLMKGLVSNH
jgi:hypothetical protein